MPYSKGLTYTSHEYRSFLHQGRVPWHGRSTQPVEDEQSLLLGWLGLWWPPWALHKAKLGLEAAHRCHRQHNHYIFLRALYM